VNSDDFFHESSDLREQARLMSGEVERGFHEILEWENELMDQRKDIRSTKKTSGLDHGQAIETPLSKMSYFRRDTSSQ